jgi:hypothetical protein
VGGRKAELRVRYFPHLPVSSVRSAPADWQKKHLKLGLVASAVGAPRSSSNGCDISKVASRIIYLLTVLEPSCPC